MDATRASSAINLTEVASSDSLEQEKAAKSHSTIHRNVLHKMFPVSTLLIFLPHNNLLRGDSVPQVPSHLTH